MEEKYNESTLNRPDGERTLDAAYVMSDIGTFVKQITEEDAYTNGDRNAITLFKSNSVTLVLMALKNGAEMSTPDPSGKVIILQVLSGNIDVEIDDKTSSVGKQQVLSFHAKNEYHIAAMEDTVFLLTYCN